jgi:hypothetical protein
MRLALLILASWLTAIALLDVGLHFLPVMRGTLPDHLE